MSKQKRTAVFGRWVFIEEEGKSKIIENHFVLIEGNQIAAIEPQCPKDIDELIELNQGFILPGFMNLHNHCFSSPLFRGLTEDQSEESIGGNIIYRLLMPMGALAVETLNEQELRSVYKLAILHLIKTGSTTMVDVFRINQAVFFDVAKELGVRAYGCPYLFSTPELGIGPDGSPTYGGADSPNFTIKEVTELFDKFDEGSQGRIRVGFGPHGIDTCNPEFLVKIAQIAKELGCILTIHAAQSLPEIELIRRRYGKSPIELLHDLKFLGPNVLLAHCVYATENDLSIIRDSSATLVTCPQTFSRSGITARFDRFKKSGARIAVGTDGYVMDFITELRIAGIISKTHSGRGDTATALELILAGTKSGAQALGRGDLGMIKSGAKADLVVFDLNKLHLQPVMDPIRTLIWNGSGADIFSVLVDGEILISEGKYTRYDESEVIREGTDAIHKIRRKAIDAGLLKEENLKYE